jgi:cysteine synthase A
MQWSSAQEPAARSREWRGKQLAATEGVLAGSSAGANVCVAIEIAKRLGPGKRVATIVADSAERYLSKDIFNFEG